MAVDESIISPEHASNVKLQNHIQTIDRLLRKTNNIENSKSQTLNRDKKV